jgi:hypothetical protein
MLAHVHLRLRRAQPLRDVAEGQDAARAGGHEPGFPANLDQPIAIQSCLLARPVNEQQKLWLPIRRPEVILQPAEAPGDGLHLGPSLFSAIGNYLVLRVTDQDARLLANQSGDSASKSKIADRLKQMPKYHALFFDVDKGRPEYIALQN